jgi:hypothetical protein
MTHGYSLRSNAKGRENKSTDETDDQAESTSIGTSTNYSGTSERRCNTLTEELDGESGVVDPRPTSPDTPRAAHNSRAPTQDSKPQTMEEDEDQHLHSRSITPSSVNRRVEGCRRRTEETWEEIQAARKREEARRFAEAVRIRRKQVVRGYEEELCALRARIVALRSECEVRVEKVRRKWELDWEIERGDVAVVVDEGVSSSSMVVSLDSNSNWEDADGEMEMAVDSAPTEMSSSCWSRSKSNFLPTASAPAPLRRTRQHQQQPHMGPQGTFPLSGMGMGILMLVEPSQLQAETMTMEKKHEDDNDDERGPGEARTGTSTGRRRTVKFPTLNDHPSQLSRKSHSSRPHQPQPQPLRRQQAHLLMGIPTGTSEPSHGLDT